MSAGRAGTGRPAGGAEVDLRARLDEQAVLLAELVEEVAELRALVGRSQLEVLRRIDGLHVAPVRPAEWTGWPPGIGAGGPGVPVPAADDGAWANSSPEDTSSPDGGSLAPARKAAPMTGAEYARLVTRIRALVRTVVPGDAVVAVVSRGDDALIDLDGRLGWHFPRCDDGRYAGHYPKDSVAAVAHLEEQRRRGARYLLFPATTLWWLDYYEGLRQHLDRTYRLVVCRNDACVIYALDPQEVTP